jgi:hypothetical protein
MERSDATLSGAKHLGSEGSFNTGYWVMLARGCFIIGIAVFSDFPPDPNDKKYNQCQEE